MRSVDALSAAGDGTTRDDAIDTTGISGGGAAEAPAAGQRIRAATTRNQVAATRR